MLWLVCVELLPNLHLAFHDDDHTHASDGSIVLVVGRTRLHDHVHAADAAPHDHADAHHSELAYPTDAEPAVADRPHAHAPVRSRPRLAFHDPAIDHAAAGLAHRALALHQPPPPAIAPIAVPRASWWVIGTPIVRTDEPSLARPTARGPPIA